MGAKNAISAEQYLTTSFPDLDKEYREGEIVERSLPDYLHAKTQALLVAFFVVLRKTHKLFPAPELRVKLGPGVYLIPDVCVFHPVEPKVAVPDSPPLVAIEILSSDDRHTKIRKKLEEYRTWGVRHVWLVDPYAKRMYTCDAGLNEVPTLRISELGIEVTPADIFE